MKSQITGILLSLFAATAFAASTPAIIPAPQKMELRDGAFTLTPDTRIYVNSASRNSGEFLAAQLRKSTGYDFKFSASYLTRSLITGGILLTTESANPNLGAEGYELTVAPNSIVIRAPQQAGLFYGVQSLLQLLPPEVFAQKPAANVDWKVPCVQIEDQPRFKWRGLMLDVSRHFFTKDEVKQFLDGMALHKLNTFHWHLVDMDGWRIEIKKYPRLTQVGAWRKNIGFDLDPKSSTAYGPDGRYGGFYTQDDIREVVAYAQKRYITIVPEIEMPGHSTEVMACYPELSCSGGPYIIDREANYNMGVFCAGNDASFEFLDNVLSEVFELFPNKYIHIGGDEVDKSDWKTCLKCQARIKKEGLKNEDGLQSYFIRRMEKFINAHGRNLIGWSEIREGGLAQNAVIMDWIGGGKEAASSGHDVVMSPTEFCYLDYYQSNDHSKEPRTFGYLPLEKVYSFEPIPAGLSPQNSKHIFGAQGNIWTEFIPSLKHVQYMAFPRACAIAEVTWSPKESRNWEDFTRRMRTHVQRFDQLGVNYRRLTPN